MVLKRHFPDVIIDREIVEVNCLDGIGSNEHRESTCSVDGCVSIDCGIASSFEDLALWLAKTFALLRRAEATFAPVGVPLRWGPLNPRCVCTVLL